LGVTFGYPVFLDVEGISILVVGGGNVAGRKVEGLVSAGATVTVVAPHVTAEISAMDVRIERRAYAAGDAGRFQLVITATDDPVVNALVAADARAAGVWANSADDPDNCSFILPAITRRGDITVAVSTGGASPALAGRLRDVVAREVLTAQVEAAAVELSRQRAEIKSAGGSTEDTDWTPRLDALLAGD
jgi:precorrin-2 dehydrogenase / sirohydrochlorin ferrochelatase